MQIDSKSKQQVNGHIKLFITLKERVQATDNKSSLKNAALPYSHTQALTPTPANDMQKNKHKPTSNARAWRE